MLHAHNIQTSIPKPGETFFPPFAVFHPHRRQKVFFPPSFGSDSTASRRCFSFFLRSVVFLTLEARKKKYAAIGTCTGTECASFHLSRAHFEGRKIIFFYSIRFKSCFKSRFLPSSKRRLPSPCQTSWVSLCLRRLSTAERTNIATHCCTQRILSR
jgi:hypothetical protein